MQMTAAVINAGLGAISLGLEMAGFNVIAAYEAEDKAATIHKTNMKTPIYQLPLEEIQVESFPKVDLLAAHIYQPYYSQFNHIPLSNHKLTKLCEILFHCKPHAFFLLTNITSTKNNRFHYFLEDTAIQDYQVTYKIIDVSQMTGFPVKEHMACIVGISQKIETRFEFPSPSDIQKTPLSSFIQWNETIDSWYYHTKTDNLALCENQHQLLCWKNNSYAGAEFVQWNIREIPLLTEDNRLRKMTPREIANLKGFPTNYNISCTNRQWLYKKLMYSGNIPVIQQIAGMISYTLSSNPWRSLKKERGQYLEKLFGCYLEKLKEKATNHSITVDQNRLISKQIIDFTLCQGSRTFYFEIKYSITSRTESVCKQLASLKGNGFPILVIAKKVSDYLKDEYLNLYGVHIWDVENLLWLFDEFSDIKNEFIAFLDYSTEHISPKPPTLEIFPKSLEEKQKDPDLKEKLLKITPGYNQFQAYESVCIEILKYVLGDYLTLWETQKPSNDGLYRFDLCCKIKNGANQDFFDTIKHYFNTKYIVFEFKNYHEKITQKEIYTTEKYLYEKALRKVAIIISRFGADEHALKATKGSLRETGKLILCLSDNSLLEMIDIKTRGEQEPAEFLGALLDDLLVHLEK